MQIVVIVDDEHVFHPNFINSTIEVLKKKGYNISIGIGKDVPKKNSINNYLYKNLFRLNISEILKLFFVYSKHKYFFRFMSGKYFHDVESVAIQHKLKYFIFTESINRKIYIEYLKKIKPDVIISSCSFYFTKAILSIPKICCINRHSSLLPAYGGVYPVFHMISSGDYSYGVTIHKMTSKIDQGEVLAQSTVYDDSRNLFQIYKKCFQISPLLIIQALDNLEKNITLKSKDSMSYNSFPTSNDWLSFRKNNGTFI